MQAGDPALETIARAICLGHTQVEIWDPGSIGNFDRNWYYPDVWVWAIGPGISPLAILAKMT